MRGQIVTIRDPCFIGNTGSGSTKWFKDPAQQVWPHNLSKINFSIKSAASGSAHCSKDPVQKYNNMYQDFDIGGVLTWYEMFLKLSKLGSY